LDELIAVGVTRYIVCGGCGVLDRKIDAGHPIILTSAVRDEGTSYHYLAPSREVKPHPNAVAALEKVFREAGMDYSLGKTWTTDAIYRETPGKRQLRMAEGCEVVEMEAAALFAVAKFRQITLGQVVYGGDLVTPEGWDGREWASRTDARQTLFDLSIRLQIVMIRHKNTPGHFIRGVYNACAFSLFGGDQFVPEAVDVLDDFAGIIHLVHFLA